MGAHTTPPPPQPPLPPTTTTDIIFTLLCSPDVVVVIIMVVVVVGGCFARSIVDDDYDDDDDDIGLTELVTKWPGWLECVHTCGRNSPGPLRGNFIQTRDAPICLSGRMPGHLYSAAMLTATLISWAMIIIRAPV